MVIYSPLTITTVASITVAIGFILTIFRFWVRLSHTRTSLGLDDLFAVIAVVFTAICYAVEIYDTYRGASGEETDADSAAAIVEHKMDYATLVVEKIAFGSVKLSLLFFFRRIFGVWQSFRRINSVMIVLVALWTVGFLGEAVFICGAHPEYYWQADQKIPQAKCGNNGVALVSFAATDFATDLMILVVPLIYIQRLQMGAKQKTGASLVFLLGFISTAAGLLRVIFLSVAYPLGRLSWVSSPGHEIPCRLLEVINPEFYTGLELQLGVWAANLPALAPLLRDMSFHPFGRISETYHRFSGKSMTSTGSSNIPAKSPVFTPSKKKAPDSIELPIVGDHF